ncbi:hypothetical protein ACEWY4_021663 [Coilia grayii]|uniref:Uncharacterized protein n=1 Tax=Coilia grayii TaxID=363190 RepID=A0ABD1J3S1_9TELE
MAVKRYFYPSLSKSFLPSIRWQYFTSDQLHLHQLYDLSKKDFNHKGKKMAPRTREPFARKLFKGVLVFEFAAICGVYALFHAMNSSRDFRSTMNRRLPSVLELYYKSNEWAGIYGIRELDQAAWSAKKE